MNLIIPFESKVDFKDEVKEICSISLEHEITQNDTEILGNFLVSGTYKEHELSVNTLDFNFVIPFSLELTTPIESDTLDFSIDNFTYDISGKQMTVKIDYQVLATEKVIESKSVDPLDLIEEPVREDISLVVESPIIEEKVQEESFEKSEDIINTIDITSQNLMPMDDDWQTYHIHQIKEAETLESICLMYKVSKEEILAVNNISDIKDISRLIIPINYE